MQLRKFVKQVVPSYLRHAIREFVAPSDPFCNLCYSQEGEDRILLRLFEGKNKGFYVDIGAHHPRRFSNTHLFYLLGWRGINIDPLPDAMEEFNCNRPKDINLNIGISDISGNLTYYMFNEPALNGFDEKLARERDGVAGYCIVDRKHVKVERLETVLKEYLCTSRTIDFLTIDVEGYDEKVLESNDWELFRPVVILVETLGGMTFSEVGNTPIARYLSSRNYEPIAKTVNTIFFRSLESVQ